MLKISSVIFPHPKKHLLHQCLKKMFTSNFKENLIGEVQLPDKKLEDIIELLNIIYPNKMKEFDG